MRYAVGGSQVRILGGDSQTAYRTMGRYALGIGIDCVNVILSPGNAGMFRVVLVQLAEGVGIDCVNNIHSSEQR